MNLDDFQGQLTSFEHYASAGFPLAHLLTPAGDGTTQPPATVQPVSTIGDVAGAVVGKVASTAAGALFPGLFSSRTVAFILGFLLVGVGLVLFAFSTDEIKTAARTAVAA